MTNYHLRAEAGQVHLAEGVSSGIELRDYLLPLHTFHTMTMPAAPGTYKVQVEAEGHHLYDSKTGLTLNHKVAVEASLVLEKASPSQAVAGIPFLAKLPCTKTVLTPTGELKAQVHIPTEPEAVEIDLYCPTVTLYLVSQATLLQLVWKRYGINLFSLKASLDATLYQGVSNNTDWRVVRDALVKKAYGHTGEIALGDSHALPDIPDLVPTSEYNGGEMTSPALFPGPAADYYRLTDVYTLLAFLELVKDGDIKLPLPSSDCLIYFPEPNEEKAYVRLLDTWEAPAGGAASLLPLEARKEYGKTADDIRELFRYRHEINEIREKRRTLLDTTFSYWLKKDMVDVYVKEDMPSRKEAIDETRKLYAQEAAIQERAMPLYADLTRWAARHKERLLKATRDREVVSIKVLESAKAVRDLVQMPSNMGKLPAHFAAIPAGLETGLHMETDQYGRAILRVRRQGLHLAGGPEPQEQIPFTLPFEGKDVEQSALMAQAQMILGPNGPRWLIPQGVVAISKLYSDLGGYKGAESTVRIYENDWVDTMRPGQVERFKQKGRGAAFGHTLKPKDAFNSLLGILSRLTYDSGTKHPVQGWSELNGFYLILANGEDSRGRWTEVMLNPALHRFIAGDGGLPYMVTNTKAMFEYDKNSLDYTPAAQMGLEQLARINIYNRNTSTISDPQGGGITRLEYANRWGILRGSNEKNTDVLRRFNRTLDNLLEAGVIAEVKVDGRDKTGADAFGVKLLITMHEDYRRAYDLSRDKEALQNLERQLATPFVVPSKLKRPSTYATPAAKKRGRPAKGSK